jgi:DNA-directed RNA polymerase subunit RPC12/RpoP
MKTMTLPKVLYHECARCRGDLFWDKEDELYVCLQCGRTTPLAEFQNQPAMASVPAHAPEAEGRDLAAA